MLLKDIILERGTQRDFANKIGVTEGMVSLILSGERSPSIKLARRIQRIYKIDLDTIKRLLNKFSLTESVEIVHKISYIEKKQIYKKALDIKNENYNDRY